MTVLRSLEELNSILVGEEEDGAKFTKSEMKSML